MTAASDLVLDLDSIESLLKTRVIAKPFGRRNEVWETIDSTNTRAMALAAEGAGGGLLVVARQQTAGRGRLGRQWVSPLDSGVYMSVLLRPDKTAVPNIATITLAVGVAVSRAIETVTGSRISLKWVNDLIAGGKKIGGILAEMTVYNGATALVIGIGINLKFDATTLPAELSEKMTWLEQVCQAPVNPNLLVSEICLQIESVYQDLLDGKSDEVLQEWRHRNITIGQEVTATCADRQIQGRAVDIAPSGALIVRTASGDEQIHAGEISVRLTDGKYC